MNSPTYYLLIEFLKMLKARHELVFGVRAGFELSDKIERKQAAEFCIEHSINFKITDKTVTVWV